MTTTDDVIGSIDHALHDFATSPDAMRWTPEPAKPRPMPALRTVNVHITVDVEPYLAAMRRASEQFAAAVRPMLEKLAALATSWIEIAEADARRSQMHAAYRARARRRTRSRR